MIFECPICLDKIKYAAVGSCMHHFCYFCLVKHCEYSNTCPMCKFQIDEIKYDREFDSLINGDLLPTLQTSNEVIINNYTNDLESSDAYVIINEPGLTIKNNLKGPGVIIIELKSTGLFYKYSFKKGDIILSVNDVPSRSHIHVMAQIMSLFQCNKPIKIVKL